MKYKKKILIKIKKTLMMKIKSWLKINKLINKIKYKTKIN
jgi:hypothetical protein